MKFNIQRFVNECTSVRAIANKVKKMDLNSALVYRTTLSEDYGLIVKTVNGTYCDIYDENMDIYTQDEMIQQIRERSVHQYMFTLKRRLKISVR